MPRRRTDLLEHWLSRKQISPAEYRSARQFQKLYDAAELRQNGAIDTQREHVNGGRRTPATERIIMAREEMLRLRPKLGELDWALLCRTLGRGEDLVGSKEDLKHYRRRIRDALAELGVRDAVETA